MSVKGGKLKADDVRALSGVVHRERAQLGLLVTLEEPSKKMIADAAAVGIVRAPNNPYPKLQIITIEQLLRGIKPNMPAAIELPEVERRASRRQFEKEVRRQLDFRFVFATSPASRTSDVVDHLDPAILTGTR